MNWILLQKHNRHASLLQLYFKKLNSFAIEEKKIINRKFFILFKLQILKKKFLVPFKLIKFLLIIKKIEKKIAIKDFKILFLYKTRARLILKKYIQKFSLSNEQILLYKKNAYFKDWRNYNKVIKAQTKKAFNLFKNSFEILLKEKLLSRRNQLMQILMKKHNSKFNYMIKKYFFKWKTENKNFKVLLFVNHMRNLALYKLKDSFKGFSIYLKFLKLKKKLSKRYFNLKLRLLYQSGERLRIKKCINQRIQLIISNKDLKEKFIKETFILNWIRQMNKINCIIKVKMIQNRFLNSLKKKKFIALLNFVKCFNFFTLRKIMRYKKYCFYSLNNYCKKLVMNEKLNYLCLSFYLKMKRRFFKNFIDFTEKNSAEKKLKKLIKKKLFHDIIILANKFENFEKTKYLLEVTFHQKEIAKQNFLRVLLRGWRFIALAEATIRKKMKFFQENIRNLHDELIDRMIDRENFTLPKDMIHRDLTLNSKVSRSSLGSNSEKNNDLSIKKKNLEKDKKKLITSNINNNLNNSEYYDNTDYLKNIKYDHFGDMIYQNNNQTNKDNLFVFEDLIDSEIGNREAQNMKNLFDTNRGNYLNKNNSLKMKTSSSSYIKPNKYDMQNISRNSLEKDNNFKLKNSPYNNTFGNNSHVNSYIDSTKIIDSNKKTLKSSLNNNNLSELKESDNNIKITSYNKYVRNNKMNDFDLSQIDKVSNDSILHEENIFLNNNNNHYNNNNIFNLDDSKIDFDKENNRNMSRRSSNSINKNMKN